MAERAAYHASVGDFLRADESAILGRLVASHHGDVEANQRNAWIDQIRVLKASLSESMPGLLCFEFRIPRIGKRADNVLVVGSRIFVIEFKVGASSFQLADRIQVLDYCLDLLNFHQGSHQATLVPILVATAAQISSSHRLVASEPVDRGVCPVQEASASTLRQLLGHWTSEAEVGQRIDERAWYHSGYSPTPTIIEAAQALYRGHQVEDISRSEAGAENLEVLASALGRLIDEARSSRKKILCLVTGVPGAGKTLAGLNLVCERHRVGSAAAEAAIFLSGNGPLVMVLREALVSRAIQFSPLWQSKFPHPVENRRRPGFGSGRP